MLIFDYSKMSYNFNQIIVFLFLITFFIIVNKSIKLGVLKESFISRKRAIYIVIFISLILFIGVIKSVNQYLTIKQAVTNSSFKTILIETNKIEHFDATTVKINFEEEIMELSFPSHITYNTQLEIFSDIKEYDYIEVYYFKEILFGIYSK